MTWPTQCDLLLVEELFSLNFIEEPANIVLIGPNGIGKTMIAKNLLHQAVLHGHTARFTLASDMLHDLAAQYSSTSLARRLRRYTSPGVLAIDESDIYPMTRAMPTSSSRSSRAATRKIRSLSPRTSRSAKSCRSTLLARTACQTV